MSWTAALPIISKVLDFIIKAWHKYKRKRDYAKRQKQAKKIEKNPARAMSEHFPGNDKLRNTSGDDGGDAGEADKTDDNSSRD